MSAATPFDAGSAEEPSFGKRGWGEVWLEGEAEMARVRFVRMDVRMDRTMERESGKVVDGGRDVLLRTEKEGDESSISACSRVPNSQLNMNQS